MIYEAKYDNGQKTITQDFESIITFIRDMGVGATIGIWQNGNCVSVFNIAKSGLIK